MSCSSFAVMQCCWRANVGAKQFASFCLMILHLMTRFVSTAVSAITCVLGLVTLWGKSCWHLLSSVCVLRILPDMHGIISYYALPPRWWHYVMMLSDVWHLSVTYIGHKLRTERPRKTKNGTEVAHVTRDSDTTFKVKNKKSRSRGGAYCGGLLHSLLNSWWDL